MTAKQYYHDIDLVEVGQLLNGRLHNVDNAAETTLAGGLGAAHEGLIIYNTEVDQLKTWDGTQFNAYTVSVDGDVVFKGTIDASIAIDDGGQPQTVEAVAGYQYVVTTAGTFAAGSSGVTLSGEQDLEVGDIVLFTSGTTATAIQRNDAIATETTAGNIRLATEAEVLAGTVADEAVTPATLQAKLDGLLSAGFTLQYTATVNLAAATPLTVNHALNLRDRDAFVVNTMFNNSAISVDVDSTDIDNLTLTSLVALTGVQVTVIGAPDL